MFSRLKNYCLREIRIIALKYRTYLNLKRQAPWQVREIATPALVEVLVPFPGEGRIAKKKYKYYLNSLKKLIELYLPRQTHGRFLATVFCDSENQSVKEYVESIGDPRIRYKTTDGKESNWGHAQTRLGIIQSEADFIVRLNCDNEPFPEYLEVLLSGFEVGVAVSYARVVYAGAAILEHLPTFTQFPNELEALILPKDRSGSLEFRNIDCMNYMVRCEVAKRYSSCWGNNFVSDWDFIHNLSSSGERAVFLDRIIGYKC